MNLILKSRGVRLGDQMRQHADQKVGRLLNLWERIISVEAELHEEATASHNDRHQVDITAKTPLGTVHSHGSGANYFAAFDLAVDRLETQLKKTKDRKIDAAHRTPRPEPTSAEPLDGLLGNHDES